GARTEVRRNRGEGFRDSTYRPRQDRRGARKDLAKAVRDQGSTEEKRKREEGWKGSRETTQRRRRGRVGAARRCWENCFWSGGQGSNGSRQACRQGGCGSGGARKGHGSEEKQRAQVSNACDLALCILSAVGNAECVSQFLCERSRIEFHGSTAV